jgi:outer membrane protein assembly factor BamE (lipoprotein component of BamABCDE complex)
MKLRTLISIAGIAASGLCAGAEQARNVPAARSPGTISEQKLAQVRPGISTKTQVRSLLGTPWRVVQFNDCGMAMANQADETWDYRGADAAGTYRVHIEFDDHDVAHLIAKIPDAVAGGKGTPAKVAPTTIVAHNGMTM